MTAFVLLIAAAVSTEPDRVELTSETLSFAPGARTAHAEGSVVARSGRLEVRCDRADATYAADRRIERLELHGGVKLLRESDGLAAEADEATWEPGTLLTLSGEARLHRGRDSVRGERILVRPDSERVEVESPRVALAARRRRTARGIEEMREAVEIRASRLVVSDRRTRARFEGSVRLVQGEVSISADRLEARTASAADPDDADLSLLTAEGGVTWRRGDQEGTCARGTLDPATGDVRLEGAPMVRQGGSEVRGERIVVDGATGRARVEKATARIRGGK